MQDSPRRPFRNRRRLVQWAAARGPFERGAEIGVHQGAFAEYVLANTGISSLLLVDHWSNCRLDYRRNRRRMHDRDDDLGICMRRCEPYAGRFEIMRMDSLEAVDHIEDGSLDWCYIDAGHGYSMAQSDIRAWYPKVRGGGILAGHDYTVGGRDKCHVKRAVDEFSELNSLQLNTTRLRESYPSWWIEKPDVLTGEGK